MEITEAALHVFLWRNSKGELGFLGNRRVKRKAVDPVGCYMNETLKPRTVVAVIKVLQSGHVVVARQRNVSVLLVMDRVSPHCRYFTVRKNSLLRDLRGMEIEVTDVDSNSQPSASVPSQLNPVDTFTPSFFNIILATLESLQVFRLLVDEKWDRL